MESPKEHLSKESSPERIAAAAVLFDNQMYLGSSHAEAAERLSNEFPNWAESDKEATMGFLTSTNRFVDDDEAKRIVAKSGQLNHLSDFARQKSMEAVNLRSQDINFGEPA